MKKFLFFFSIWLILLSIVYILQSESQTDENNSSDIKKKINTIVEHYGDRAFMAFYSLDELRPYCILQIDRICDMYGKNWLSPFTIIQYLTNDDKVFLKKSVAEYIDSFEDESKEKFIISRIANWCKADLQFTFLNEKLGIYRDNIYLALNNVNRDKQLHSPYDYKAADNEIVRNDRNDYIYSQTLNLVSSMTFPDQLKFYGDIYYQLAVINK